ncbi:MAG: methyltransferase domain-containing protein [Gammaproteobacteria bacterium]|nr:methyltransferase domain-containing protein [Gammaproteobacteria bacterium]
MTLALRQLEPELLDTLPADDPCAQRARRDLQRVNVIMGHVIIWKRIMKMASLPRAPRVIVELGAGDGTLMLRLARRWAAQWPHVKLYLVDRQPAVADTTISAFTLLGWDAEAIVAEVTDWLTRMPPADIIVTNLFLHHFSDTSLPNLLHNIAQKSHVFAACEPCRSRIALIGSQLLALIGCGPVARYDAVVSVRAGFSGHEISSLWPAGENWQLQERSAGLFSHVFIARHTPMATAP